MKNLFVLLLSSNFMFLTPLRADIATESNANEYLQFTAGGHVIAFIPECLYLTGKDQSLSNNQPVYSTKDEIPLLNQSMKLRVFVNLLARGDAEIIDILGPKRDGIRVTLTFVNTGATAINWALLVGNKAKNSEVILTMDGKKEIAPVAEKSGDKREGYSIYQTGTLGLFSTISTKPFGKTEKIFLFPTPKKGTNIYIKIGKKLSGLKGYEPLFTEEGVFIEIDLTDTGKQSSSDSDFSKSIISGTNLLKFSQIFNHRDLDSCRMLESALQECTDQVILAEIVQTGKFDWIRKAAVKNITDQSVLIEVAKTDSSVEVRKLAVKNITDQNALVEIARNNSDWYVRMAAIYRMTDQDTLTEIATKDPDWQFRQAATEKLTNQDVLIHIAQNDSENRVREAAVEKVTDNAVLVSIVRKEKYQAVTVAAIDQISDPVVLADIARNDLSKITRNLAVMRITDQKVLAEIAKKDTYWNVRMDAVKKIDDQVLLAEIAKTDTDYNVYQAAIRKLKDQNALFDIARTASNDKVRCFAAQRLSDQNHLYEVAKMDPSYEVRSTAVNKISGQTILADFAKTDLFWEVRNTALKKIYDRDILADLEQTRDLYLFTISWADTVSRVIELSDMPTIAYTKNCQSNIKEFEIVAKRNIIDDDYVKSAATAYRFDSEKAILLTFDIGHIQGKEWIEKQGLIFEKTEPHDVILVKLALFELKTGMAIPTDRVSNWIEIKLRSPGDF